MNRQGEPCLFVFDWDGTLSDSVGRIVACLRLAAAELGLEDLADSRFSDVIGLGLPEAIAQLYPRLDEADVLRYRDAYAAHFTLHDSEPSALFPDALEVLLELRRRGHRLAVATGKSRRGLDRVLAKLGLESFFDATRCADESASKPDPRMLQQIYVELDVHPSQAVMVGDTEYDMEMARLAGSPRIGVGYGVHCARRLARHEPALIIDALPELLHWPGLSGG